VCGSSDGIDNCNKLCHTATEGQCPSPEICNTKGLTYYCQCVPKTPCIGATGTNPQGNADGCGWNDCVVACGSNIGSCAKGYVCNTTSGPGTCVPCTPNCSGKVCGNDGCGGSCGPCSSTG
jgi:hypothetical protein